MQLVEEIRVAKYVNLVSISNHLVSFLHSKNFKQSPNSVVALWASKKALRTDSASLVLPTTHSGKLGFFLLILLMHLLLMSIKRSYPQKYPPLLQTDVLEREFLIAHKVANRSTQQKLSCLGDGLYIYSDKCHTPPLRSQDNHVYVDMDVGKRFLLKRSQPVELLKKKFSIFRGETFQPLEALRVTGCFFRKKGSSNGFFKAMRPI